MLNEFSNKLSIQKYTPNKTMVCREYIFKLSFTTKYLLFRKGGVSTNGVAAIVVWMHVRLHLVVKLFYLNNVLG